MITLKIIFWLSGFALVHTYIIYPIMVRFLSRNKKNNVIFYDQSDNLPEVSVLMAVHNEASVIKEKMESLLAQDYPAQKLSFYIGSDCSTDATNDILENYKNSNSSIHFFPFHERQGKPGVINVLEQKVSSRSARSNDHIYLLTDASVMLEHNTLKKMVRHFKNNEIVLVDAHMMYSGVGEKGIARSENKYLNAEVLVKNAESRLWGKMIGPFGGCFCIRSSHFRCVPQNYLVDDFYIAMTAMQKGGSAINDLEAKCFEQVSHKASEEYRRKKRISTGNFQNLFAFKNLLNPFTKLGFSYVSHKVLRWMGPFFIIAMFVSSFILAQSEVVFFKFIFAGLIGWFFLIPSIDRLLSWVNIKIKIFRSISYFNHMNLALLHGFIEFLFGVKSSIWQPTER